MGPDPLIVRTKLFSVPDNTHVILSPQLPEIFMSEEISGSTSSAFSFFAESPIPLSSDTSLVLLNEASSLFVVLLLSASTSFWLNSSSTVLCSFVLSSADMSSSN